MSKFLLMAATACLLISGFPRENAARGTDDRDWRSHWREGGYDGVTALYTFLSFQGVSNSYSSFVTDHNLAVNPNFSSVVQSATRVGKSVSLRRCTADELDTLPLPVISHLDAERDTARGEFVTLIKRTEKEFIAVNGSNGCLTTVDKELLLRQWSGVVMFTTRKSSFASLLTIISFGGLSVGYWTRRHATKSEAD